MSEWKSHDGKGVPNDVTVGALIRVKYRNGYEHGGPVTPEMLVGPKCVFNRVHGLNPWFWAVNSRVNEGTDIIEYIVKRPTQDGICKAPKKERV